MPVSDIPIYLKNDPMRPFTTTASRGFPSTRLGSTLALGLAATMLPACVLFAQPAEPPKRAAATQPADPPATQPDTDAMRVTFPGITVNRNAGYVDLDATVVLRDGQWLELLACSPNTREHESILTASARPSHLHLALLLIGLEPGQPMRWEEVQNASTGEWAWVIHPARGDRVKISIVTGSGADERVVPASSWIVSGEAEGEAMPMPDATWIFAGSTMETYEAEDGGDEEAVYAADAAGNVISLVNFGDDVLVKESNLTNQGEGSNAAWNANTEAIPEVGAAVRIRLEPAAEEEAPAGATP